MTGVQTCALPIWDKRKKQLLKKYKTVTALKKLTIEDLKELLPEKVAIELYEYLQAYDKA